VDLAAPDPSAPELLTGYRWWALAELSTPDATIDPPGLATLVTRFLAGDLPTLTDVVELPPSCLAGSDDADRHAVPHSRHRQMPMKKARHKPSRIILDT
jgi:hypothetical protein